MTPAVLLDWFVEFSAIAALALAAAALLRNRSAALRHWILSSAVVCVALMPVLGTVLPAWRVPVTAVAAGEDTIEPAAPLDPLGRPGSRRAAGDSAATVDRGGGTRVLLAIWLAGIVVNGAVLIGAMVRLRRVGLRARAVCDPRWLDIASDISRAYGLRRQVSLLEGDHPGLLVTWGAAWPKILLPRAAREWGQDRLRVVLAHELAHIKRGDWLVQIAAEVLQSIHWFNPLAWLVCRRLRHESERAADDAVLSAGIDGREYAAHLLELARAVRRQPHTLWPAPAIVHSSTLERRVAAMLATHINRAPLTRSARLATLALLLVVAAAIASAQGALASFSGSVLDPSNRTVPGVEVTVTNVATNAARKVRSDDTGRFEFAGLPHGEYEFEAKFPGFMALRGRVNIAAQNVQQPLTLEVGSVRETIVVVSDDTPAAHTQHGVGEPGRTQARRVHSTRACESTPHGGNLTPPLKLVDVRPFYPPHLASAGVAGVVQLQGVIAKDGALRDLRVIQAPHPDLQESALAAVRQWEFTGTMLNCMPIDVAIGIRVEFKTS
jgi:TonB family protein